MRLAARIVISLILFGAAAYGFATFFFAAITNRGHGSDPTIFWPALGLIAVVALGLLWAGVKVSRPIRARFANRNANPS